VLHTTIQSAGNDITLKLQGRLAGASVQELAALWTRVRGAHLHDGTRVDLTSVMFIDEGGKRLLQDIRESGGQLIAEAAP
jgi:anti-anti-sigma regulatory factor